MTRRTRLASLAGAVLALAIVALPAGAGPASAHATILGTTPADGSELKRAPASIRITFDESVALPPQGDAASVLDQGGRRVDTGAPALDGDRRVLVIRLAPDLPKGTYIASWTVVSADSHPVGGSLQFGVRTPAVAVAAPASGQPSPGLELAAGLAKAAVYLGLVLGLGLLPAALLLGAEGASGGSELRHVTRAALAGLVVAILASAVQLAVQYLWDAATAPAGTPALSGIGSFAGSGYAIAIYVRVLALALAAVALPRAKDSGAALIVRSALVAVLGLVAVGALVENGHGASSWWQFLSTLLHASAAIAWIGGLVLVGWLLLRRRLHGDRLRRLPRWSLYAATCVLVLASSGLLQSVVQVRYAAALFTTQYGVLLLTKLALVLVVLALAVWSHLWLRARLRESAHAADARPAPGQTARLRTRVRWEAGVACAVVAISGVLSSITPAEASYAPRVVQTRTIGPYTVTIEGGPARRGPQSFRVTAVGRSDAAPLPRGVQLQLDEDDGPVRAVNVTFPYRVAGVLRPGRPTPVTFTSSTVTLPRPGAWRATVTVVADRFDQYTADVRYPVQ